jgi:bifunctional non-homologous end joining protein LigD
MSKHDGFRIMARRDAASVRFLTRNGHDFAGHFPLAAGAVAALPARSCLIDGEAIVTDRNGLAVFDLIRGHRFSQAAVLCAFDLLELDGEDLRREPIKPRKSTLKSLLRGKRAGIALAQSSTVRLARSAARAWCRSAWAHPIASAARAAG